MPTSRPFNSLGARAALDAQHQYYRLARLAELGLAPNLDRLPFSIKILLEAVLRNLDGECVVCHTVGFGSRTGYEDEVKTPFLKHVGCESCHGPGSGHMSAPRNAELLKLASPWKQNPGDRLPDLATMKKLAELNPIARRQEESKLPPADNYAKALFPTLDQQGKAKETITKQWDSVVGVNVKTD